MRHIFGFVKFFKEKEHMDAFLCGNLYMNSLSYFLNLENDSVRGDPYEAVSHHYQPTTVQIKFNEIMINSNELAGPVIIQSKAFDPYNVLCLYAINSGTFQEVNDENYNQFINSLQIHEKNKDFGDFCVVIYDVETFLERIKKTVLKNNFFYAS